MLIIVEGPDLAGKTTLVRALAEYLTRLHPSNTVTVRRAGPPTSHPLDEYVTPLLGYRPGRGQHVICDRWHWGERVYPKLLNRPTQYDDAVHRYVELFLQSRGAIVVNVTCDELTLRRRYASRGDGLVTVSQLGALRRAYLDVQRSSVLSGLLTAVPPMSYESTDAYDLSELTHSITRVASAASHLTTDLNEYATYVGHPHPELLLLGDVRHEYATAPDVRTAAAAAGDLRPAFMPYASTSGHYLLRALTTPVLPTPLHQHRVGLMNVCDVDDAEAAWRAVGRPDAVLLGANAQGAFPEVPAHWAFRIRHAPHPQYVRRFFNDQLHRYRDQLIYDDEVSWRRDVSASGR